MAVNPNSLKNLEKGTKFFSGDSRIKRSGRIRGKPNLEKMFAKWLKVKADCKDPAGNDVQLPLADKVVLALINKACKGDVSAANVVLGNAYGHAEDEHEEPAKDVVDWSVYTDEELEQLAILVAKGKKTNL